MVLHLLNAVLRFNGNEEFCKKKNESTKNKAAKKFEICIVWQKIMKTKKWTKLVPAVLRKATSVSKAA